jgi:uncharacterized protein (DUF2062 family)
MSGFWIAIGALIPSIGLGVLFYFVMRSVIRADRNERAQLAELDRQEAEAEGETTSEK